MLFSISCLKHAVVCAGLQLGCVNAVVCSAYPTELLLKTRAKGPWSEIVGTTRTVQKQLSINGVML